MVVVFVAGGATAAVSRAGTQTSSSHSFIFLNNIRVCSLDPKHTQNNDNHKGCSAVCERHGCLLKEVHGARYRGRLQFVLSVRRVSTFG
jgi:hypothetical protein